MTNFHFVRHAPVVPEHLPFCYGATDVPVAPVCAETSARLAARLPQPARWFVTPLSRTRATAEAVFASGYQAAPLAVEPGFIEQHFGDWHGTAHDVLPSKLTRPAHPFWIISAEETPPNGESSDAMKLRVGAALERLAADHVGEEVVVVAHGGSIRGALAHALDVPMRVALHFSIRNQSITRLRRAADGWHVMAVNETP